MSTGTKNRYRAGLTAPPARGCLYHAALLPRTITAPASPHTRPGTADDDPRWGERAQVALDVFDGTIRRTEALLAHLHCNGYDITTVSGRLAALRSVRGGLARACATRRTDLLDQVRDSLEQTVGSLCSDIVKLRRHTGPQPAGHCTMPAFHEERSFAGNAEALSSCRHAVQSCQHA